jgi:hypothetical protein
VQDAQPQEGAVPDGEGVPEVPAENTPDIQQNDNLQTTP